MFRNFGKQFDGRRNRKRNVNKIRAKHSSSEISSRFVNYVESTRFGKNRFSIETNNVRIRKMFSQRKRKRPADKSRAEYGYAMKSGGGIIGHVVMRCGVRRPAR